MTLRKPGLAFLVALCLLVSLGPTRGSSALENRPEILSLEQWDLYSRLKAQPAGDLPGVLCWSEGTSPEVMAAFASLLPESPGFQFDDPNRWSVTATEGGGLQQGDPTTLTWGILPDSVDISTGGDTRPSRLIRTLDILYGSGPGGDDLTQRPWFPLFQDVFDRWSSVSGVRYVYEPADDEAAFPGSDGALGVRPDVRIGGRSIDGQEGPGILGFNYYPANGGDMVLDTDNTTFLHNTADNSRSLRNLVAHEHGHGLGLAHSCPVETTKLMEPLISLAFDGPQHDDILGVNRGYGDRNEYPVENDEPGAATDLGSLAPGETVRMTNLSMDGRTDVGDFFTFSVGDMIRIDLTVAPAGTVYFSAEEQGDYCPLGFFFNSKIQDNLGMKLLGTSGTNVLAEAAYKPAGFNEEITNFLLTEGAGNYFVQVFADTDNVQLYDFEISVSAGQAPVALCKNVKSCRSDVNLFRLDDGSYDPDGDTITYSVEPPGPYPPGVTEVLLVVEDGILADTCRATVTVNRPPVASAQNVVVEGTPCDSNVLPDAVDNGSSDPDGDDLTLILEPAGPYPEGDTEVSLIVTDTCNESDTTAATVSVNCTVPVRLLSFTAERRSDTVFLAWEVADAANHAGFHVYREVEGGIREQLSEALLSGGSAYTFTDDQAPAGKVEYWLGELSRTGALTWYGPAVPGEASVLEARMGRAHPNPFAGSTTVRFALAEGGEVLAAVYDIRGRRVRTLARGDRGPGVLQVSWNGRDENGLPSPAGLYFLRLVAGSERTVQKIVYAP